MRYRSQILRPFQAPLTRWSVALFALCLAGCQNNTERDLIARDRRAQEDQLYAMGDYISQYQQLVCQYRSENATLRRQLAATAAGTSAVREPQLTPQREPTLPATRNAPRTNNVPGYQTPSPSTPKLDVPDVPPLNQGSSIPQSEPSSTVLQQQQAKRDGYAVLASYNEPAAGLDLQSDAVAAVPRNAAAKRPSGSSRDFASDVLLTGEVIKNAEGGPRLMVDVEKFDQSGHVIAFEGEVSLVLVTSDGQGGQRNAAKWDFSANDVRSAITPDSSESTMRFRVELPASTKIGDASELWVRLSPTDGKTTLSHAALDVSRPGVFSSRTDKIWASEESVIAASYFEDSKAPSANEAVAPINQGTWATALPGKPVSLPKDGDRPDAGWRASNEVIPERSNTKTFGSPSHESWPSNSSPIKADSKAPPLEVAQKPSWTPERPGKPLRVARPTWSATR